LRGETRKAKLIHAGLCFLLLSLMIALFAIAPIEHYDRDWQTFRAAARHVLAGESPYASPKYYNPPWLAVLLVPLALLPTHLGWATLATLSLVVTVAVAHKYLDGDLLKVMLVLLSPPPLYTIRLGQVDALLLAALLLPAHFWPLAALTKPQLLAGLVGGVRRENAALAAGLVVLVFAASIGIFGLWPLEITSGPGLDGSWNVGWNVWAGLWPFQMAVFVALLMVGRDKKSTMILLAASPFLSPYAATSSFIGLWLAACSWLKGRQAVVVWVVCWGAVAFRAIAG
jgi:hypothetical protein